MRTKLICLFRGHDPDVSTTYEFDPEIWIHTWTQMSKCLRCGKLLFHLVTKMDD